MGSGLAFSGRLSSNPIAMSQQGQPGSATPMPLEVIRMGCLMNEVAPTIVAGLLSRLSSALPLADERHPGIETYAR
jgi:hypothetical protein